MNSDYFLSLALSIKDQASDLEDRSEVLSFIQKIKDLHSHFVQKFEDWGNAFDWKSSEENDLVLAYLWPKDVRDYCILLRDIAFNYLKAATLVQEESKLLKFRKEAILQIHKVAEYFETLPEAYKKQLRESEGGKKKQIAAWKVENSIYTIILDQISQTASQIEQFTLDQERFVNLVSVYLSSKKAIIDFQDQAATELQEHHSVIKNLIIQGSQVEDKEKTTFQKIKAASPVESNEAVTFSVINSNLEEYLKKVDGKYRYPVDTLQNQIIVKDVNLKSEITTWLESEIYPLLYEIEDIILLSRNDSNMALVNLKNRVDVLKGEKDAKEIEAAYRTVTNALESFAQKSLKRIEEFEKTKIELSNRTAEINLENFYNTEKALFTIPLERSLKSFGFKQNEYLNSLKDWISIRGKKIGQVFQNIEEEDKLSSSERIVRYVKQHASENRSQAYANIFLTKGFIGESFVVGREKELHRMRMVKENWEKGDLGTILLSGKRLTGKSLTAYVFTKQEFNRKIVKLRPNTLINIAGRNYKTGFDLEEALNHVIKFGLREQLVLWIDDIELWQNETYSLLRNVRNLVKVMYNHGDKLFFLIATNHWVSNYLNTQLSWKGAFRLCINLDRMSVAEVAQAIEIRHGATHKSLIGQEGQVLSPFRFRRKCKEVYQRSDGAIGVALHWWANSIQDHEEDTVVQSLSKPYYLPNIIDEYNGPILKVLLMRKLANEYMFRKILGANFNEKYKPSIQRLNHLGLLHRRLDSALSIKNYLVNDIAGLLHNETWIDKNMI
jgi:hypothetical protein